VPSWTLATLVIVSGGTLGAWVFAMLACEAPPGAVTARPPWRSSAGWRRLTDPAVRLVAARLAGLPLDRVRAPIARWVAHAGDPPGQGGDEHLALCVIGLGAGLVVALPLREALSAAGVATLATVGACYPIVRLRGRVRRRLAAIDRALAHANDLIVLSLEAGSDLLGALRQYVGRARTRPDPLCIEIARVLGDLDLGSTRKAALLAMAERAPSDAVKGFVGAVVQAEQRGTPLSQALRIQAVALRIARSQCIEARAARASVLVMLPLLLIFGATVLLVFGGVIVRAMRGDLL
jgi:tight adherence protein C